MEALRERIERRVARLEERASLDHGEQLEYLALWQARGDAHAVPEGIDEAVAILRDPVRFFDGEQYARAVDTIDAALRVISAAHAPLQLDFTGYRTPFALHDARGDRARRHARARSVRRLRRERARAAAARRGRPAPSGSRSASPGSCSPPSRSASSCGASCRACTSRSAGPPSRSCSSACAGPRSRRRSGRSTRPSSTRASTRCWPSVARSTSTSSPAMPRALSAASRTSCSAIACWARSSRPARPARTCGPCRRPTSTGWRSTSTSRRVLTLPYDPTRGCYWGKCTFCHYGLAEVGTASYRERAVETCVAHLAALSAKHGTRHFYLSQDSVAPKTIVKLAGALADAGLELRWATDLKPEQYLTAERAETLRRGGAVACALGVESASPRVLELIDKGAPVAVVSDVIGHLAAAGIAAEAMCFTGFPTETLADALATLRFLDDRRDEVAAFIVGAVRSHARRARRADAGALRHPRGLAGRGRHAGHGAVLRGGDAADARRRARPARRRPRHAVVELAAPSLPVGRLAVDGAHGPLLRPPRARRLSAPGVGRARRRDRGQRQGRAGALRSRRRRRARSRREAEAWQHLVRVARKVSRQAYGAVTADFTSLPAAPGRYRVRAGEVPVAVRAGARGRRPPNSPNALG